MTTKILATVDTENWASLAEVSIVASRDVAIHLSGPDGSIAAGDPMTLRFEREDAVALHRELALAIGTDPLVLERNQLAAEVNFHRAGHDMWKSLATTRQAAMDGFSARLDAAEAEAKKYHDVLETLSHRGSLGLDVTEMIHKALGKEWP
jgi:hypothetical protein